MTTPFELTAAARFDVLQIWNYSAELASVDVADAMLSDLESAMMKLTDRPGIGHRREDITHRDLRFYLVHRYFVIYRDNIVPLRIIRVLHASQNIKKIINA